MRLGIKGKQIAGVTAIVGMAVVALSALYVTRLAGVVLHESHARGQLLSNAILHRAREVVTAAPEPYAALRDDPGLRAILESSLYGESVTGASMLDPSGIVIASSDPTRLGLRLEEALNLAALVEQSPLEQLRVIYSPDGQTLQVRQPMVLGDEAFGSIRIGVSTLLMRQEVNAALRPALLTAAVALGVAVLVAGLLAQLLLRPIHVIRSGLTRLGQGEVGVTLDLPPGDEFGELGSFFNAVSQQLSADRAAQADQQTQQVVAHSRKLVALWRLTAGIAHEVKNPLNAMMIHVELLKERLEDSGVDVKKSLEVIGGEIRRLDRVVQGFLKFMRPQELTLKPVDLNAMLQSVCALLEAESLSHGVRFVLELDAALPAVSADEELLRQAFINIVQNAVQAMPSGGAVRIRTRPEEVDWVRVTVTDQGVGIAPEDVDKIFKLYYTSKPGGSGIGLSVVYRIVQLHDGTLEAKSELGRGTAVIVRLPVR